MVDALLLVEHGSVEDVYSRFSISAPFERRYLLKHQLNPNPLPVRCTLFK